jgi:hypothetical protein
LNQVEGRISGIKGLKDKVYIVEKSEEYIEK